MRDSLYRACLILTGSGSTAEAIWLATLPGGVLSGLVEVVLVIATRKTAGGIQRLIQAGFPESQMRIIDPRDASSPDDWGRNVLHPIMQLDVNHVGLHGCLVKLPSSLVNSLGRLNILMLNQHPGWPREFGGDYFYGAVVAAAQLAFARRVPRPFGAAAACQLVHPDHYDRGALLRYTSLTVDAEHDTVERLQAALLPFEHALHIGALKEAAEGTLLTTSQPAPVVVQPGEERLLVQARRDALRLYWPHGKWSLARESKLAELPKVE